MATYSVPDQAELEQLLRTCRQIRPDVRYICLEHTLGDLIHPRPLEYWAHTPGAAFSGFSPGELLDDLLASVDHALKIAEVA